MVVIKDSVRFGCKRCQKKRYYMGFMFFAYANAWPSLQTYKVGKLKYLGCFSFEQISKVKHLVKPKIT